jgi:hypothetical protein
LSALRSGRFTPRERAPWYPLYSRLGGPQSRSGRGGEEKNSQPLPGFEPPIVQPLAQRYTIELSRFLFRMLQVVPVIFLTKHHAMKVYWGVEV